MTTKPVSALAAADGLARPVAWGLFTKNGLDARTYKFSEAAVPLYASPPQPPAGYRVPFYHALFEEAPCYLCGYNGPGYYQRDTHPCANRYHDEPRRTAKKILRELLATAPQVGTRSDGPHTIGHVGYSPPSAVPERPDPDECPTHGGHGGGPEECTCHPPSAVPEREAKK